MYKFEIPYNFNPDGKYFIYLEECYQYREYIDNIYLPCYIDPENKDNQHNTREELSNSFPKTLDEYAKHIHKLQEYDIPLTILIQRNATYDIIKYYIDTYGIMSFIINDDDLAKKFKNEFGNDIDLRLSITRKATFKELCEQDLSMYDNICLFFWFGRHLDKIKELPDKYNYSILVNSDCLWNCSECDHHWFNGRNYKPRCREKMLDKFYINMKTVCYIRPEDLNLFYPYISVFKIQGRERSSRKIFKELKEYIKGKLEFIIYTNFDNKNIENNYNI